jgi:hypothetical protein
MTADRSKQSLHKHTNQFVEVGKEGKVNSGEGNVTQQGRRVAFEQATNTLLSQ